MAMTQKEKNQQYEARMKEQGFSRALLWVHNEDKGALKQFALELKRARLASRVQLPTTWSKERNL